MRLPRWVKHLAELCYPSICPLCDSHADSSPLCAGCTADLHELESAPCCDRCAYPLADSGDPCPHCRGRGMGPMERILRLGTFQDPLRGLVHRLKYRNDWPLAEYLATRLAAHEPVKGLLTETDCLAPIPLHPLRQFERGYNQADIIARRLGRLCRIPTASPLARLRNTQTQTNLRSHEKRAANLRGAFGMIEPHLVRGKRVVLVDDVMTSGATLLSAARVMKTAEPASISAIVLGVADPRGRGFEMI